VGLIAFDIRNHLLLDPDRLEALLLIIDTLKLLATPPGTKIVSTGEFVTVPTFAASTLIAPDGTKSPLTPDRWGRVRFRPLQAGRYLLVASQRVAKVYANYYDEAESDLATQVVVAPPAPVERAGAPAPVVTESHVVPLTTELIVVVLLILLVESAALARRSRGWGFEHV
jgi:hypothetical protein